MNNKNNNMFLKYTRSKRDLEGSLSDSFVMAKRNKLDYEVITEIIIEEFVREEAIEIMVDAVLEIMVEIILDVLRDHVREIVVKAFEEFAEEE